jgi:HEAT repeat protein
MPDLPERIAGDEQQWVKAFLATTEADENGWMKLRTLRRKDVELLGAEALRLATGPRDRSATYLAISSWGLRELAPRLVPRLRDDPPIAAMAANALTSLRSSEAIPELVKLLDEPAGLVARDAIRTLNRMEPRVCDPLLAKLVEHPNLIVRARAISASARVGRKESLPAILQALKHPDEDLRNSAMSSLSWLGGPEHAPLLLGICRPEEDRWTQAMFLEALARLDRPLARQQALTLLGREEENSWWGALNAVPQLGFKECIPAIQKRLSGNEAGLAAAALADLGAVAAIPEIRKLLEKEGERFQAAIALGRLGSRDDAPRLRTLLSSPDPDLRLAGLWALGELGDRDAIPGVEKLLEDPNNTVRGAAIQALVRLRAPSAHRLLLAALEDPERKVAHMAAWGLPRIRAVEAIPRLERMLLTSKPREGRALYVMSLLELGGVEAIRGLAEPDQKFVAVQGRPAFNALRAKDAWRSLNEKMLSKDLEGPVEASLETIAREVGLTLELSIYPSPAYVLQGRHHRIPSNGVTSLRDALDALLREADLTYILEKDRVRILWMLDALDFWVAWWSDYRSRP